MLQANAAITLPLLFPKLKRLHPGISQILTGQARFSIDAAAGKKKIPYAVARIDWCEAVLPPAIVFDEAIRNCLVCAGV